MDIVTDCDPLITDFTGVTDVYTSGKALYFNDMSLNTTYLCVQAKDKAGNATYATAANPFNFAPDVTAPLGTITTTGSTSRSPDLVGTVDDPTASVYIDIAGGNYLATNNTDGTWTLTANNISPELVPGTTYPIQITLVDNAANTTIITGSLDIIADTIPPVTPTL